MKTRLFLTILVSLFLCSSASASYVIDGDVSDWGIDLGQAQLKYYLNNNNPSGGLDIDYAREDNADTNDGWIQVYPGWSIGNGFDAEAFYFDNDATNAYIALIQGMPDTGEIANGTWLPGDIAINADNNAATGYKGYELGLALRDHASLLAGRLYSVTAWNDSAYSQHSAANPWDIKSVVGSGDVVEFVYTDTAINGHYVIEASIPLSLLGIGSNTTTQLQLHWAQQCGNDMLNLTADVNPVPEPSSMALLFISLIVGSGRSWFKIFFRV
ncbi:MAG: PEP-CTERM sorting domain-containing protein [Candidatus Omnitrophota bacterium]